VTDPDKPRCHGCGAAAGEVHDRICDVARCRATGLQWVSCDRSRPSPVPHEPDVWTGKWPGTEDCERLGWSTCMVPGGGWVPCAPDTVGAQPDLNRLYSDAEWDPLAGQWRALR
jgi:hypothetical protein